MTLPKRHRRKITCAEREFYWYFPQGRDADHRRDYHLVVQCAKGEGQLLKVSQTTWSSVTPSFVVTAILEALHAGWLPDSPGEPFILTRSAPGEWA